MYSFFQASHEEHYLNILTNVDRLQTNYSMNIDQVQKAEDIKTNHIALLEKETKKISQIFYQKNITPQDLAQNFRKMMFVSKFLRQNQKQLEKNINQMRNDREQMFEKINPLTQDISDIKTQIREKNDLNELFRSRQKEKILKAKLSGLKKNLHKLKLIREQYATQYQFCKEPMIKSLGQKLELFERYIQNKINIQQNQIMEELFQELSRYVKGWFKKKEDKYQIVSKLIYENEKQQKIKTQKWFLQKFKLVSKQLFLNQKKISPKRMYSLPSYQNKSSIALNYNKSKSKQKKNTKSKNKERQNSKDKRFRQQTKSIQRLSRPTRGNIFYQTSEKHKKAEIDKLVSKKQQYQRSRPKSIYKETTQTSKIRKKKIQLTLNIILNKEGDAFFLTPSRNNTNSLRLSLSQN